MIQNPTQGTHAPSKIAARIAIALGALFLAILFLLHFLKPELDPSWRMISEYEIGNHGWLMRLAFFCWGGSVLALLIALQPYMRSRRGKVGFWWLAVIVIAFFGAGIFITNPIMDEVVSTTNTLHTLCGAIVIFTFPIAASLVAASLRQVPEWKPLRGWLLWGTLLLWLSQVAYFSSIIVSNAINPDAGRVGPQVYQGWPNRFMVLVYVVWVMIAAAQAVKIATSIDKKEGIQI